MLFVRRTNFYYNVYKFVAHVIATITINLKTVINSVTTPTPILCCQFRQVF